MLTEERFGAILHELKLHGAVTVAELSEKLGISESTVRRDLQSLDSRGLLKKVHGGATVCDAVGFQSDEADVSTKAALNVAEKERIARYAATLIRNDDFVYLDAGTTTEKMIDYIDNTLHALFVTNGIVHAKKLIQKGLRAYIIGGQLKLSTEAVIGAVAVNNLKQYNFTKAFMGANGITVAQGFTTPDTEEGLLKAEAVNRSYMTYVLADSSKFNKVFSVTFAPIEKACILTDRLPDDDYKNYTVVREVKE
ncbi:MAG: DeoR/GlpR family DNA-binding transcription regulator [Candidatus Fimenecus sp.]